MSDDVHDALMEVARWLRDGLNYPFDFVSSMRPPKALTDALVEAWAESADEPGTTPDDWAWAIEQELASVAPDPEGGQA